MTSTDPMPELCNHDDPSWCTAECEEKIRLFDEWAQRHVKDSRSIAAALVEIIKSET